MAALERVRANLKRYRAAVLKAACEGRLVPTEAELARREGRTYEPADQLLARILKERRARWEADQLAKMQAKGKITEGRQVEGEVRRTGSAAGNSPELPDGWVWATVVNIAETEGGTHYRSGHERSRWRRSLVRPPRCWNVDRRS